MHKEAKGDDMASATTVQGTVNGETQADKTYRRRVWAWALYDVADHAYITTFASTFFPPYFIAITAPAFIAVGLSQALAHNQAADYYAYATSLALFIAAIIAPVVGTYADITGARKRLLVIVTIIGGLLASSAVVLTTGMWELALGIYLVTQLAINIALGLISSLLPHVARADDMNRVSSLGYAMGYFGGGILLLINTIIFLLAGMGKMPFGEDTAVRIAFFTVGVWWIAWMVPAALGIPEPPATPLAHGATGNPFRDSFTRIRHTLRDIQRYRELFKMLIAFWFYMEGIGGIILLATAFGAAKELPNSILIGTLLMTQFVAFPYALIFGRIANPTSKWRSAFVSMLLWTAVTFPLFGIYLKTNSAIGIPETFAFIAVDQLLGILFSVFIGRHLFKRLTNLLDTKRAVILGLVIYTVIPIWGYFLQTAPEFLLIGWLVGTVQGGTQALSRSIYADLSPKAKSGEFFGLYGLAEKFSGVLAPLLFAIVGTITNNPNASVFSITIFFLIGILLLWRVNEGKGAEIAAAEEAQIEVAKAAD